EDLGAPEAAQPPPPPGAAEAGRRVVVERNAAAFRHRLQRLVVAGVAVDGGREDRGGPRTEARLDRRGIEGERAAIYVGEDRREVVPDRGVHGAAERVGGDDDLPVQ